MSDQLLMDFLQKQNEILAELVGGSAKKSLANHSTYTPLHGPGGIWTGPGLERDVITAHVRPSGIASQLPLLQTVNAYPLYGILTGYTDVVGDEPETSCEDAPAGYVKGATLTSKFGLLRRDSQTIDMDDVMMKLHRGDFTDLALRGQVLGLTNLNPSNTNQSDILNLVSASEMVIVGVNVERALSRQLWQGSPAAGQFPGLDRQIATGIIDAVTGVPAPAIDSDVKNFGYDMIGGSGRDIVEYLGALEFYLNHNATTMGLDPVEWAVVMRPELWNELSAVWPCAYNTTRCAGAVHDGSMVVIDGRENIAERDAMRSGMYIDINGKRYRVVTDTGIFEKNNINDANLDPGQYASSIYMIPLRINGNFPVTYREYLDYRQAAQDVAFTQGHLPVWWTDNGVFSWSLSSNKWCYQFHVKTQQRVILRTPHLAGRIDDVAYAPLQHLRSAYPDDPYFADGGVSLRSTSPGYQSVWD
jgi:hypothetical protein